MDKNRLLKNLNRVRGQVEGLKKMVEAERECEDILVQVKAANKALQKIGEEILRCNLGNCIDANLPKNEMKAKVEGMVKGLLNM